MGESRQYEVALSFAGEQRAYVEEVARHLGARGVAVFYDDFEKARLWGQHLSEAFHKAFEQQADFVVMFISRAYVEKPWPRHERRSALSRMVREKRGYILPVRFDATPVDGLPDDVGYVRADERTPAELAALIAEKPGIRAFDGKASSVPPPRTTSATGEVIFDYSSHDGRYVIGSGELEFETIWTKASDKAIYLNNYAPSINGVALAPGCNSISEVMNAERLDFTSRVRRIAPGGVAVLRNTNGFYAAIHVIDIKDDSRRDDRDELRFQYAIQGDGTDNFMAFVNM